MKHNYIRDIFRNVSEEKRIEEFRLNRKQKKLVEDISSCKTAACGSHLDVCENCGTVTHFYNSCRNPSCPVCQAVNREEWCVKQKYFVLNTVYFHTVFTIPDDLNPLVLLRPSLLYNILFEASAEVIKELSADPKYLGATPGFISVLHSWGAAMTLHPHIHMIIAGGGINSKSEWVKCRNDSFLFPVKVMSALFKGKFLSKLKNRFDKLILDDPEQFQDILNACYKKDWVVYAKEPMANPDCVIEYLSRYVHRIAISNSRILSYENGKVTFLYKDYRDNNKVKPMTLTDTEFVRRFLMHVPPLRFMRIRYYGFLSNSYRNDRFILLRKLTSTKDPGPFVFNKIDVIKKLLGRDPNVCQHCKCPLHPKRE